MPATRRPRTAATGSQPLYDGSGSDDTDLEATPKPQRHGVKKRLSVGYIPDNDASFTAESGRVPLKSVNVNDDTAERRRRRKSTKFENAQAGPSHSQGADQEPGETPRAGRQKQIASVAPPQAINVPLDVMSSNFEEWMKMATDNKINAANSWNFALIDYFHDMSLLRNNADNTINFQRASCTLDGCVKIWTSRVDSVGTETGKLLSNLATEGQVDEDEPTSDNPDGGDPSNQRKRAKAHRPESTLAKSAAQLKSKKLELEFSVDPLFKKTCADFDEGGAQGLLMNHLSLGVGTDGGLRVVFDASDSIGKAAEDDEETREPEDEVDLSYLRKEFLSDLSVLDQKAITHSLSSFSFAKDAFTFDETTFFRDNTQDQGDNDDDDDDNGGGAHMSDFGGIAGADMGAGDAMPGPIEDFFVGDQAVGDDFGGGDVGIGMDDGDDAGSVGAEGDQQAGARIGPGVAPFDPRHIPNERDLVLAMTDADADDGMMDYFDQSFLKNWAGPEHWKLRKVVRKPEADPNAPKPRREKKEAFKLDFSAFDERDMKDIDKELFAPVTRGAGINLPGIVLAKAGKKSVRGKKVKARTKEKKDDHLLPDDMHFSSRQLVTLFLKPKFSLKMRGQRVRFNQNDDREVDEHFWAQAAADQAAGRVTNEEGDETAGGGAIPFNTQFFHDDYDDAPGFDDGFDGDGGAPEADAGDQDLLAATQGQTRRIKPEFVNYAKRAKRVDVRKLKENIWKGLNIVVEKNEREQMDLDDPPPPTDPSEARVFSSVISGLQRSYPRDKLEEISTSFCFICLLHLANEEGLKLESVPGQSSAKGIADDDAEVRLDENRVGKLWDLRVYRDPNATRAA